MTLFPRRVALVSEHADPLVDIGHPETGGQNVYVAALATELAALGCAVDVYTRQADPRSRRRVTMAPGVVVHRVVCGPPGPIARDELMPVMPAFAAGLAAAWRRRPPDVVHAHFWMSGWAATAAAPSGTPVVLTFHALGTVKQRHQGVADTSPPERIAVERRLLQTVDTVVATCRDEVAELDRLGRGRGHIVVVPCGVSATFSPFGPVDATPRRQPHRLVTVSRIVPRKGIGDVVRALAQIPDAELVVVGGSDPTADAEAAGLRDLGAELGVADRLELRGRLDAEGVAAVMRSADAVVCAPWYEPFGIVPVEAMACGVPVVGTAVGGLLDTVHDGRTGLLVPPRRPDALAAALNGLLGDPPQRRRMGVAGAERAQRYTWPRVAAAVLDLYGDVLARRGDLAGREALA